MSRKFRVWGNAHPFGWCASKCYLDNDGKLWSFWGGRLDLLNPDIFIVSEFSGEKDSRGKDIYEGDILLGESEWGNKKSKYSFCVKKEGFKFNLSPLYDEDMCYGMSWSIIGNLFERPDLSENLGWK